jgi:hypothetical protein
LDAEKKRRRIPRASEVQRMVSREVTANPIEREKREELSDEDFICQWADATSPRFLRAPIVEDLLRDLRSRLYAKPGR